MSSVENAEERKESLAVGDPEAGYGSRDMSGVLGTGTVPDVEQEAYDANVKAQEDEQKKIEDAEDKVVKARRAEAEKAEKETASTDDSATTSSTKSSSKASAS